MVKFTWNRGFGTLAHFLNVFFTIGASLNDSMVEVWAKENVQSAEGQSLALQIGNETVEKHGQRFHLDEWSTVLVACGLWVKIKEPILPKLMVCRV